MRPWPFGPGEDDVGFAGSGEEVGFGTAAVLSDFGVAGGGDEGGANADASAGAQDVDVVGDGGADDDEFGGIGFELFDGADGLDAEDLGAVATGGEDGALVAAGEEVVKGDGAEAAGVRRCAGDDDAVGFEEGSEGVIGCGHGCGFAVFGDWEVGRGYSSGCLGW